jgi:hypothetical protein
MKKSALSHSVTVSDVGSDTSEVRAPSVKVAPVFLPARSTKPLTIPVEFKFAQRKSRTEKAPVDPKPIIKSTDVSFLSFSDIEVLMCNCCRNPILRDLL